MDLNLERVRGNVKKAGTEDLLDRVTIYRREMEPEALEIIEAELITRGMTRADIEAHLESRQGVLTRADGTVIKCQVTYCYRPAMHECRHWHKLFGVVPLFRVIFLVCDEHCRELVGAPAEPDNDERGEP